MGKFTLYKITDTIDKYTKEYYVIWAISKKEAFLRYYNFKKYEENIVIPQNRIKIEEIDADEPVFIAKTS